MATPLVTIYNRSFSKAPDIGEKIVRPGDIMSFFDEYGLYRTREVVALKGLFVETVPFVDLQTGRPIEKSYVVKLEDVIRILRAEIEPAT